MPQPAPAAPRTFPLAKAVLRRSEQSRARPSQGGPSAGARGPPSIRLCCFPCARSAGAIRLTVYFEKNVLVVAHRREQPVQTLGTALSSTSQSDHRGIFQYPVRAPVASRFWANEFGYAHRRPSQRSPTAAHDIVLPFAPVDRGRKACEHDAPVTALSSRKPHDPARSAGHDENSPRITRSPRRGTATAAWRRIASLGEGLERVWARRDLVSSRRAVLLKIDLFVLLSEGERCGATSAGEIARATAQPSFSRVTARDISPAHEVGQSLSSRNKTVFGPSEDPGYYSVRHFRHGKLWPIAKRPSQRTLSVALIGLALIGLELWDPRWTLLGREVLFCGEFYFTKRQAENLIDDESPAVKRCQTAQSMVELEGAQGIRRPRGAETWASAKEKNQFATI
ncbi:hypothetical protein DFH06DRAFT_1132127 [Mycena polygramma]|nr:hypothetical protein DFH06DRAFT_1132127 [Mycena polygramma]